MLYTVELPGNSHMRYLAPKYLVGKFFQKKKEKKRVDNDVPQEPEKILGGTWFIPQNGCALLPFNG